MQEQSSLTLITKDNGKLTGERAQALPIKIVTTNSGIKFIMIGFILASLVFTVLVFISKSKVVVVETTGKGEEYKEYKI